MTKDNLNFRYDDKSDIFVWTTDLGFYIASPTGKHLVLPEDKPHKNTVIYRCLFFDLIARDKPPIHITTGREGYIAGVVAFNILKGSDKFASAQIQDESKRVDLSK